MTSDLEEAVSAAIEAYSDNFDRLVTNELTDLINVPGEKDFTPERLRYYKDGTRRFLQYGTDANYSESPAGHLLEPDAGQTLTLKLAERATYPVGFDLWPSASYRLTQAPQSGDRVGWGFGEIDLANFDPSTNTWSGTTADGYFAIHTADTGLSSVLLAGVRDGTIFDSRVVDRQKAADILTILEARLNWYDVGPAVFRETFTDIGANPLYPQQNEPIGAVASDDGKAAAIGSHRAQFAIHQASGNSGLGLEAGSMAVKSSGAPNYQFKTKGHSMDLDVTNGTEGTYQVCGALRSDPGRPTIKLRIPSIEIISTPDSSTTRTRVLLIAVDPSETDASFPSDATPEEHNAANSVVEQMEDNTLTGPVEDDAGTDVSGSTTANTMTNPGGYQVGRDSVTPEGSGSKTKVVSETQVGNRSVYDTDVCLILVDANTTGTCEIDVLTEQNS